eukprot:2932121-Alexandrium_andersonii.AAC.1
MVNMHSQQNKANTTAKYTCKYVYTQHAPHTGNISTRPLAGCGNSMQLTVSAAREGLLAGSARSKKHSTLLQARCFEHAASINISAPENKEGGGVREKESCRNTFCSSA